MIVVSPVKYAAIKALVDQGVPGELAYYAVYGDRVAIRMAERIAFYAEFREQLALEATGVEELFRMEAE